MDAGAGERGVNGALHRLPVGVRLRAIAAPGHAALANYPRTVGAISAGQPLNNARPTAARLYQCRDLQ